MIYETFREAVKNIWSNKFRTVLTMLGIIIGVTAVIVIVGLGNGMTQSIKDSFSEMGTNVLSVQITGRGSRTVTVQQLYDIVDSHPEVFTGMSPTTTLDSTVKVDTTTYGYTSVKGVSETYLDMMGRTLAQGRGLTYVDITDNKKVCVVGDYIARAAYGGNAIGQQLHRLPDGAAPHPELFCQRKLIGQLCPRLDGGIQNVVIDLILHLLGQQFVSQM